MTIVRYLLIDQNIFFYNQIVHVHEDTDICKILHSMADLDSGDIESGSGSRLFGGSVSGSGSGPKFIMNKILK
jgi:hypothetical protein